MSKGQAAAQPAPRPRAIVLVLWEDTANDGPRTWATGLGTVAIDDVDYVELEAENNADMAGAKLTRYIEDLDLLGRVS